jgi:hypothetical protein
MRNRVDTTHQPHGPNNGAAHADRVRTTAAVALPPTASPSPVPPTISRRHLPTASGGYKKNTPPREQPFSSSAPSPPLCPRAAIIEPPRNTTPVPLQTPRHRPELRTDPGSSLDLLADALGCSSTPPWSLPSARFAPPWNPPFW